MADYYDVSSDPYIDQQTGVLHNKFGILDQDELDDAESDITSLEIAGLTVNGFTLLGTVSLATYAQIHKQLFSDIYDWAGKFRVINIAKDATKFCDYQFISAEGEKIFDQLRQEDLLQRIVDKKEYTKRLAYYYSELNMLHPFREGNGRTLRTFISVLAMNSGGNIIAWDHMDPQENIDACAYAAYHDESKVEHMLAKILDFA
ncbi:MAG: cell filamentation protein [Patescibacteria group bacterium]|nr:cell filamentation protein [Patescibacteria group bacterium]